MHYWKVGPARLLSHLNVMQLMERAMIRAEFPLRFTEGFNPRPKFATSPAIPLGMSSHSEYIQFELQGELPENAATRVNASLIEGLVVQSIVPQDATSPCTITQPLQATYEAWIESDQINGDAGLLAELMGRVDDLIDHLNDHSKGNDFCCSSKDHDRVVDLWVESSHPPRMGFTLSVNQNGVLLKPRDFLEQVLQCPPDLARKFLLIKETVSFQAPPRS
jgi:radical SAM-linked protein